MKNLFKKAVSLTVALSTVAVLSVSAFAATTVSQPAGETYTITANESCDAITVTNYTGSSDATQYAVAIVKKGFDGSDDSDIYYVNQSAEAATLLTNMLVKATLEGETLKTTLPDGDYEVRIGNNDPESGYVAINFTVTTSTDGGEGGEDDEEEEILYGDVFHDGKVNNKDLAYLQRLRASWVGYDETTCDLKAADVALDGKVNNKDLAFLQRHRASWLGYETLPIKQ